MRVQDILDEGDARPLAARAAKAILLTAVVVSVAATSLETVEPLTARYRLLFAAIELVAT